MGEILTRKAFTTGDTGDHRGITGLPAACSSGSHFSQHRREVGHPHLCSPHSSLLGVKVRGESCIHIGFDQESSMKHLAALVLFVSLPFQVFAQSAPEQKTPDKDADKKQAVAAASSGTKKKAAKDEKKEEPKKEEEKKPGLNADTFSGLKFRSIGPGVESGRVMSIAVNPNKKHEFYVGVASGGVWKTVNDGTTWTPLFDGQGSYSIGWVELDPRDSSTVWVGSGESNSQ